MPRKKKLRCSHPSQRGCVILTALIVILIAINNFILIVKIIDASKLPPIRFIFVSDDIVKYKMSNFSLCDIGQKSRIYLGSHHKTGTMLLNYQLSKATITPYLREHCNYSATKKRLRYFEQHYHFDAEAINESLQDAQKWSRRQKNSQHHIVMLNIIRNPVDTVISAYNYHRKGSETWTQIPLHLISRQRFKYQERKENICSEKLFLNLTESMGISTNISIKELYSNILHESEGIRVEYLRYHNCCFQEIYSSYTRIKQLLQYKDQNYGKWHFANLRSEDFQQHFEESCNSLMDKLGIIEPADRAALMRKFKKFDLNALSAKQIERKQHITKGKFNKTKQIQLLLTDNHRCSLLKEQTISLEYFWNYSQFC